MNSIHVQNLSFRIGKRLLLDDVSLHADTGERIAIVGPNGAGKTTLLRCLLGFIYGESGVIKLNENPLTQLSRQEIARMIGYVPQQLDHDIPFTVLEFIMMSRYAHAQSGGLIPKDPDGDQIARQATERTGIQHLENQSMSTLSGGERQKVNIAAALAQQTPILVLDEPSSHLDPKQRESIQQLLGEIGRKSKTTILAVTHDLNWAAMDFDRIIGMSDGRVIADAPPVEFMTSEILHQIFNAHWTVQPHPESGLPMILPTHHPAELTADS
ncbi:MAG: ABC transporter ATP-binding protein [Akkermansiaceae bacterium]|tara:strand:- start:7440 stop:8249 length:810 start_codon:yes stop_codon:yes gene_type:complete